MGPREEGEGLALLERWQPKGTADVFLGGKRAKKERELFRWGRGLEGREEGATGK